MYSALNHINPEFWGGGGGGRVPGFVLVGLAKALCYVGTLELQMSSIPKATYVGILRTGRALMMTGGKPNTVGHGCGGTRSIWIAGRYRF